jgi:hypothetical protein
MVGSPLSMLAYARTDTDANVTNGSSGAEQQSIRLFFQTAYGNIKVSDYDGLLSPWQDAK